MARVLHVSLHTFLIRYYARLWISEYAVILVEYQCHVYKSVRLSSLSMYIAFENIITTLWFPLYFLFQYYLRWFRFIMPT